jgi:mannosyltransferase
MRIRAPHASILLLSAITIAALVVRLRQSRESLWLDELHSAWAATGAWTEVASRSVQGNQSPFFFWIEWLLVHTIGRSELAVRLPSLVAGVLLVVAVYWLVWKWTAQRWLALLAAWLVAIDPQATYFGTEARPYALVQLLGLLHVALFLELVERPTALKRAAMIVGAALLFHLHYTTALLFAGELAWYVWRRGNAPTAYTATALARDFALGALLAAPALGVLREVFGRRENWKSFVEQQPIWAGVQMLPWGVSALVTAAVVAVSRWTRRPQTDDAERTPAGFSLTLMWLLVPVTLAWLATATDTARVLSPRYLAASAPAAIVLLALALSAVPEAIARTIAAGAFAIVATATSPVIGSLAAGQPPIAWRTDDWRGAINYFNAHPLHGQGTVLLRTLLIESDGLTETSADGALAAYSLYPLTSLYPIDAPRSRLMPLRRSNPGGLRLDIVARIDTANFAWVIVGGPPAVASQVASTICEQLSARSITRWVPDSTRAFGSVSVTLLERRILNPDVRRVP